jgi:hypothetical protein
LQCLSFPLYFLHMALFPGNVDPEKIIGMKPEDLKAKLDASATKDDIKAIGEQVTAFNSGLSELKASLAALTTPKPEPIVEDPTDPTTKLLLDPKGMIRDETKGLMDQQQQTAAQLQEMRARQNPKLRGAFEKYGDDMVKMAERYPLSQRAQPGFWEWHAMTYVGNQVLTGKVDRESYPSLIGSSSISPNSDGTTKDPNEGFDPQVADWLRGRNVPLARAARLQMLKDNGEQLTLANYKGGNA